MADLIRLAPKPCKIDYPEDVDRMRTILNEAGYDASDHDIQWAYGEWSEEHYCASWMSPSWGYPESIVRVLLEYLKPIAEVAGD